MHPAAPVPLTLPHLHTHPTGPIHHIAAKKIPARFPDDDAVLHSTGTTDPAAQVVPHLQTHIHPTDPVHHNIAAFTHTTAPYSLNAGRPPRAKEKAGNVSLQPMPSTAQPAYGNSHASEHRWGRMRGGRGGNLTRDTEILYCNMVSTLHANTSPRLGSCVTIARFLLSLTRCTVHARTVACDGGSRSLVEREGGQVVRKKGRGNV